MGGPLRYLSPAQKTLLKDACCTFDGVAYSMDERPIRELVEMGYMERRAPLYEAGLGFRGVITDDGRLFASDFLGGDNDNL